MLPLDTNACYVIGAAAGTIGVWVVKQRNGEIECVLDMARTKVWNTLASMSVQVIAAFLWVSSGELNLSDPLAAFWTGAGMGAGIDAYLNKGKRAEWTEAERERKRESETETAQRRP